MPPPPPPPAFDWAGPYIGLHGGGGWGHADTCLSDYGYHDYDLKEAVVLEVETIVIEKDYCKDIDEDGISLSGPYVGAHAGYNFLLGNNVVLGVEADINWSGIDGYGEQFYGFSHVDMDLDWFGTVRGRLGLAMGDWMPYITGGLAYGQGTRTATSYFYGTDSASANHTGWTIGGGLEKVIAENWTMKGEYKYIDLGTASYSYPDSSGLTLDVDMKIHTFEIGFSRHF